MLQEGAKPAGTLGIIRNYQNAFLKINGKTLYQSSVDSNYMDAVFPGSFSAG